MSPEFIGRLVSGGISILIAIYSLMIALGVIKLNKDPNVAEEKRLKFKWLFWALFVSSLLIGILRIVGVMPG